MFIEIQRGVWLNTDHIITINFETNRIETTPGFPRSWSLTSINWKELIEKVKGGE